MKRPRVLLADDHTVVMEGLKKLLESDFEIAGAVEDGAELVAAAVQLRPDVVLMDISMPGVNGIDAAVRLRSELPEIKLIFLTMHADPAFVTGAFRAGAQGYILKRCAAAELVNGILQVLGGRRYITPEVAKDLPAGAIRGGKRPVELTTRELEVLQLVAEGKSAKEIASILKVSPKTVVFHKSNLMQKVGVRTTAGLIKFAVERTIIHR